MVADITENGYLSGITEQVARSIFKYYGGFSVEDSSDCLHLMAGSGCNCAYSDSEDGTVGRFVLVGDNHIVAVTARSSCGFNLEPI